jgi:hypothetical protein
MRQLLVLSLLIGLLGSVSAQSVRSLGMAGLIFPGPEATFYNPAYAAFPNRYGAPAGFQLPIGLLGFLRPGANPLNFFSNRQSFIDNFDLLTFYDQFNHLGEFLINPARSPERVIFNFSANSVSITDGAGRPINLDFSVGNSGSARTGGSLTPPPLLSFPLALVPGLYLELGLFAGIGGFTVAPDANLRTALATQSIEAGKSYGLEGKANASAGVSAGFAYATLLPNIPDFEGKVYVGARGEAFYGLAYVEATGRLETNTDANKIPGEPQPIYKLFTVIPGSGNGFGLRADLGTAVALKDGAFGLGVRNAVGFARWNGTEYSRQADPQNPGQFITTSLPSTRSGGGVAPAVFVNGAYQPELEVGTLLVGADLNFASTLAGHLGLEYALGPARFRTGLGLDGGFKFGLGAGLALPGLILDTALTTHTGPVVGGTVFGIALSAGFNF